MLEIALANAKVGLEDGCPAATPQPTTDALHSYAKDSRERSVQGELILSLC